MKRIFLITALVLLNSACNPTVRVEAGSEPIRIEANITISHEIKIKVEKDVEEVLAEDDLF
ncbi:MAG: YnbE family lipoprotein [Kangiellaceae bacterium]|nr:YnbE family lipoprotein [Kangiellaceae bacterium]MCW9000526.1 YnbE family lipoprotein [Kangiellaceae bacterium]MCW9017697.1 YnbE family lipoprotein [Kangiellaceae bacterium]